MMAWGWLSEGARVWRRRKEKTISQSARWAAISRMLHLRGAGQVSTWAMVRLAVRVRMRSAVRPRTGMGS